RPLAAEDSLALLKELERTAAEAKVAVPPADRAALKRLIAFEEARARASHTLAAAALEVVRRHPEAPVALHVGTAHTATVVQLLEAAGQPYAVITPRALADPEHTGDLSFAAVLRKDRKLSVDEADGLGGLLDGRTRGKSAASRGGKRPAPV